MAHALDLYMQFTPRNTTQEIQKMRWLLGLLNDDTRPWDHEAVELAIVEYTRTLGSNEHTEYVWEEAGGPTS